MLKGFSMRFVRDRRMIRFGRRWNTTHVASEVPAAHHDADENGMTALHWEAKQGCPDVVKSLVDAGADIEARNSLGRSPLLVACENGNFAKVKMLVEAGASVRATDKKKETCLTLAAHHGHTETVRYLVGLPEVDVDQPGRDRYTALHSAVIEGHSDVVQVLIDAGADIEAKDYDRRSPLLVASALGNLGIVKMLFEAGAGVCVTHMDSDTCLTLAAHHGHTETVRYLAGLPEVDINHKGKDRDTALHKAVYKGHSKMVQVLIDAGADIEVTGDFGRSPLLVASTLGNLRIAKMLVKSDARVCVTDHDGDTCLTLAAHFGNTKTVRYLASLPKVEVNYPARDQYTALHSAVNQVHPGVVQVLIDAGADLDAKDLCGNSPLDHAIRGEDIVCVKMLVEAGAALSEAGKEVKSSLLLAVHTATSSAEIVHYLVGLPQVDVHEVRDGSSVLFTAVRWGCHGDDEVVKVLIDAGAVIEAKDEEGQSPLLVASSRGSTPIVKVLVEAGAKVCVTDNEGDTCLICAVRNEKWGHTETVSYLAGLKDVDVNHKGQNMRTALHCAVDKGHIYVVQVLIDAGADIEAKDNMGHSPLHLACRSGTLAIVKMLVDAGAGVHLKDNEGGTCLMLAGAKGHTDIVRYLANLQEVDTKQTARLGNTALEAVLEQGTATKEEVKALQEMMKSVMDQQKEMLEAQKGVLGALNSLQKKGSV